MTTPKHDTWMPLYVGDYLRDTQKLQAEQHGAYLLLIMEAWTHGGSVPEDPEDLAAIARVPIERWQSHTAAKVLPFFTHRDGRYWNDRVVEELERAKANVSKKSKAGVAGAAARWRKDGNRIAEALPEQRQSDAPSPSPSPTSPEGDVKAERKRSPSFDAAAIDLPDWLDREAWASWCTDRKKRGKPITEAAARLQVKQLGEYLAAGHLPESVIEHSIAGGFQGLYPPKVHAAAPGAQRTPETFAERSERHARSRVAELIGGTAPSMHDVGDVIDVEPGLPRLAP